MTIERVKFCGKCCLFESIFFNLNGVDGKCCLGTPGISSKTIVKTCKYYIRKFF